ncbi:MAG: CotH kinase family protein, partial [Clostridia bacterium]|nr:CotH kinase family protein [Clostridia bacterium]
MRKLMKWMISACLCLAMLVSVLSVTAFAAEGSASNDAEAVLSKLLKSSVYVEKNKKAGLRGEVNVALDLPNAGGVVYLPGSANAKKLRLAWDAKDVTFSRNGKTYKSGKAPIAPAGKTYKYKVSKGGLSAILKVKTVQGSSDVDAMFLEIDESKGSILAMQLDSDHETSCYGKMKVGDHKKKYVSIKGRGSSTWLMPKKPYNMTVYDDETYTSKDKTELIDGVKVKKWTLLANYFDNALMRNKIAYDLADQLGIGLKSKFVDLWMNGTYLGSYLLTPKKDTGCSDDGFIIENNHQLPDEEDPDTFDFPNIHTMPLKHNYLIVDDIGDNAKANGVNTKTIEKWFTKAWDAVLDKDSEAYQKYFDLDSWAKMYLMFEVSKTYDCYAGNILMHRDGMGKNDKLYAGPAWDYDIAFGRTLHKFLVGVDEATQLNAEGWYNDSIGYYATGDEPVAILQELGKHPSFMKHVAKVYNEYKWAFEGIDANIVKQEKKLRQSAYMNNALFGTNSLSAEYVVAPNTMEALGTGKYKLNYEVTLTWDNYIHNLREYCQKRVMWLSDHLAPGVDITTDHGGTVST